MTRRQIAIACLILLGIAVLLHRFLPRDTAPVPELHQYLIIDPVGPEDFLKTHRIILKSQVRNISLPAIFRTTRKRNGQPASLGRSGGPLSSEIDLAGTIATVEVEPPVRLTLSYDAPLIVFDESGFNVFMRLAVGPDEYIQKTQLPLRLTEQQFRRRLSTGTVIELDHLR